MNLSRSLRKLFLPTHYMEFGYLKEIIAEKKKEKKKVKNKK